MTPFSTGGSVQPSVQGLFASTLLTLFVIPVSYWLLYAHKPGHGLPSGESEEAEPCEGSPGDKGHALRKTAPINRREEEPAEMLI